MKINKIQSDEIVEVGFNYMIITASKRKRFEFERTNNIINASIVEPLILKAGDFTCFSFYGEDFSFGKMQALVIKELYDKYYAGDPWVHGKLLLKKAGRILEHVDRHTCQLAIYRIWTCICKDWRQSNISQGRYRKIRAIKPSSRL